MKPLINPILLPLLLFFCPFNKLTAGATLINGRVMDQQTRQGLPFSNIHLANTGIHVIADAGGKFRLSIPQQSNHTVLIISCLGYRTDSLEITGNQTTYDIYLSPLQSFLNEVVVTGVSKAMLLRENPVAIVTVSSKKIEQSAETNIIDVLAKNVAGLNVVKTGPNISKPFIRGLGYNRVLTLYDGIRQEGQQWGDEHGIEADAYNIGKAEVVKGPASIMYGSDALAGVVSLIPEIPARTDETLHGKYFTEYQSNHGLIGNGFRLGLSKKQWTYALRGSYRIAGNYRNQADGIVYNTGFRETNASVTVQHDHDKGFSNINLTIYNNLQGIPDGSRDSLSRRFTKQVNEGSLDDIKNRPVVSDKELTSYRLSPLHQHIQHYRVYSNNHYLLGNSSIDATLAFQQNIRKEFNHPTKTDQAGMYVQLTTIDYHFRYNAPVIVNTEISAGVNGMYQSNQNKHATDFPIPDYHLSDNGIYLFAKWKKGKLSITGGLRYDTRFLNGDDFYTGTDMVTGFGKRVYLPDTTGAVLQFPAFRKTFHGLSASMGITCQLSEKIHLKFNIGRGYRAPGITEFASNGLDPGAHIIYLGNRNFLPEFSLQEDVGLGYTGKDLSAAISLFNNNVSQYIYLSQLSDANGNAVTDVQGNKTFQYQQSAAQLYGAELNINLHPAAIKGFSMENAFSIVYGKNKKNVYQHMGTDGEFLPLMPPAKIASYISQEFYPGSTTIPEITLKAELEYCAAQNRYLGLYNTETATPGYALFGMSISTTIKFAKNNRIYLQLQGANLFDKVYQSNLSRLKYFEYYTASPDGTSGMYNMGRNICIKAILSF